MAAVLASGPGALLSHWSAAALWRIMPERSRAVDVMTPGRCPRTRPGIRIHRVIALDPRDDRVRHRIPVTAPARTLLDLAAIARPSELEQAFAEAQAQRIVRATAIASTLGRYPRHRGRRALDELVRGRPALTRSEAERRLLELVRRARLPEPETAVSIGPYEVDFLWRAERLVIEVDGFQFHSSRASFERDRMRDAELQSRGYRVVRITWRQHDSEPEAVLVRIVRLLGAPSDLEAPTD
jgi:very-short-patch-repair endonuclease